MVQFSGRRVTMMLALILGHRARGLDYRVFRGDWCFG